MYWLEVNGINDAQCNGNNPDADADFVSRTKFYASVEVEANEKKLKRGIYVIGIKIVVIAHSKIVRQKFLNNSSQKQKADPSVCLA